MCLPCANGSPADAMGNKIEGAKKAKKLTAAELRKKKKVSPNHITYLISPCISC